MFSVLTKIGNSALRRACSPWNLAGACKECSGIIQIIRIGLKNLSSKFSWTCSEKAGLSWISGLRPFLSLARHWAMPAPQQPQSARWWGRRWKRDVMVGASWWLWDWCSPCMGLVAAGGAGVTQGPASSSASSQQTPCVLQNPTACAVKDRFWPVSLLHLFFWSSYI